MKRILIERVDKLGDFCHTLPAISLMKRSMPDAQIDVIVSPIIKPLAEQFDFIDNLLIYKKGDPNLIKTLKAGHYDAIMHMHSHKGMAIAAKKANIPYRLGQKRKWFQMLYTHRASFNRSGCLKPEWRYCTDHIEYFLCKHHIPPADIHWRLWDISEQKQTWQDFYGKQGDEKLIFIHPGSGGSEAPISVEQFAELAQIIDNTSKANLRFIVTFGPGEEALAQSLVDKIQTQGSKAQTAKPLSDIGEFSKSLVAADMMIAGSTGPLHVASLHNSATVGFYPHGSRDDKIRWQTLSDDWKRLAFSPPMGKPQGTNMKLVNIKLAGEKAGKLVDKL